VAGWQKGRGALGPLKPLLGTWTSEPAGPGEASATRCKRRFETALRGAYVRLDAHWQLGPGRAYEEIALFGKGEGARLEFRSFTSDGKQSHGIQSDGGDVHPQAIAFEARMPAGLARMIYWPGDEPDSFYFAVENRTKKGWNRFFRHLYRRAG
jgi:hypothetical protein